MQYQWFTLNPNLQKDLSNKIMLEQILNELNFNMPIEETEPVEMEMN